ncbi:uncharacterized protein [Penaeus vannamei]|uniref:uncharacterized protein n=1 Tax=Penaeus vannamei TaxID=6689 RepID=UPI00387F6C4D
MPQMPLDATGDQDLHLSQMRKTWSLVRRDKEQFIRSLSEEVGHFLALFTVDLDAGSAETQLPDPPISEDPPSLTEVREAIYKLKSGKTAGICDIPAELLTAGSEPMVWGLHVVLAAIWWSGTIPPDLLREHSREFEHGLLVAYIDLRKAFVTVHHESLKEILRQWNSNKDYWTNSVCILVMKVL